MKLTKREHKFRAWDGERMVYFSDMSIGFKKSKKISPYVYFQTDSFGNQVKLCNHDIMEFTGLHDKNGADIYEGDLLNQIVYPPDKKGNYDSKPVYLKDNLITVCFIDGCFSDDTGSHLWRLICNINDGTKTDYEVVGNVFNYPKTMI